MNETTQLPQTSEHGHELAADQLLPLIYDQLHALAATMMAKEKAGQTLQTTALVSEAYLRLVDQELPQHWDSRNHFFAAAAEAMRRILVENARKRQAEKRGRGWHRVPLDDVQLSAADAEAQHADEILAVDETLERFAAEDPAKAELVKLRYFAGLSVEDAANLLGISRATAERQWSYARAWLYDAMTRNASAPTASAKTGPRATPDE